MKLIDNCYYQTKFCHQGHHWPTHESRDNSKGNSNGRIPWDSRLLVNYYPWRKEGLILQGRCPNLERNILISLSGSSSFTHISIVRRNYNRKSQGQKWLCQRREFEADPVRLLNRTITSLSSLEKGRETEELKVANVTNTLSCRIVTLRVLLGQVLEFPP